VYCFNSEWSPSKTTSSRAWRDVWAAALEPGTGRSGPGRVWSRTVYQDAVLVRGGHLPFVLRSLWRCFCAKTSLLLALSFLLPSGLSRGRQGGEVFPGFMALSSLKNVSDGFCLTWNMHKIRFQLRLCRGPRWGSLQRSPRRSSQIERGTPSSFPFPSMSCGVLSWRLFSEVVIGHVRMVSQAVLSFDGPGCRL